MKEARTHQYRNKKWLEEYRRKVTRHLEKMNAD